MSIIYPSSSVNECNISFEELEINRFYFISILALTKMGRNDYLISSHLCFELCKTTVLFQMLIRDKEKNTCIYRQGDKEEILILQAINKFSQNKNKLNNDDMKNIMLNLIFSSIDCMEKLVCEMDLKYLQKKEKFYIISNNIFKSIN